MRVALGEHQRLLDDVLQLAHVARPARRRMSRASARVVDAAAPRGLVRGAELGDEVRDQAAGCPRGARAAAARAAARRAAGRRGPRGSGPPRPRPRGRGWSPRRTRTSTLIVSSPPTRSNSRSCSTRSSLTCIAGRHVADLVEEERAPSASSKRPSLRLIAPVNAPFSWPNSSLSSSVSVSAPQLTLTNGPAARFERAWIARATSSLPVPLSPGMKTVASVGATFSMVCEHGAHRRRLADDARRSGRRGGVGAQRLGLGLGALAGAALGAQLERALDLERAPPRARTACEEVERAELHRLDRGLDGAERGDDHRPAVGIALAHRLDHVEPVHALHLEIGDDEVGGGGLPPVRRASAPRPRTRPAPPRAPCGAPSRPGLRASSRCRR